MELEKSDWNGVTAEPEGVIWRNTHQELPIKLKSHSVGGISHEQVGQPNGPTNTIPWRHDHHDMCWHACIPTLSSPPSSLPFSLFFLLTLIGANQPSATRTPISKKSLQLTRPVAHHLKFSNPNRLRHRLHHQTPPPLLTLLSLGPSFFSNLSRAGFHPLQLIYIY